MARSSSPGWGGLAVARGGGDPAGVFALDLSDSVPAAERRRALALTRAAAAAKHPGDRFGLVTFGAEAIVADGLSETPRLAPAARPAARRARPGAGHPT